MKDKKERLNIVFEDNHLIIVNKKAGVIVQGDKTGDESLLDKVKQYVKVKYDKPGDVYLGLVHRIDRPVSGLVIFAKTSKALTRMNNKMRDREIKKTYWAIIEERPPKEKDKLVHYLKKDSTSNKSKARLDEFKGSKKCELTYKLISASKDYNLLEVDLITGRHHQVRAQLAAISCVIKGDLKYGAKRSNKDGSIALHSRSVEFQHPVKDEKVKVIARTPKNDNLWTFFEDANK